MTTLVAVCTWCEKVFVQAECLLEPDFTRKGRLNPGHGVCKACHAHILGELERSEWLAASAPPNSRRSAFELVPFPDSASFTEWDLWKPVGV